jgi:hypothetical protein
MLRFCHQGEPCDGESRGRPQPRQSLLLRVKRLARQKLLGVLDRFAGVQAENLNVHGHFSLLTRIALPVRNGKVRTAGIWRKKARTTAGVRGWSSSLTTAAGTKTRSKRAGRTRWHSI